MQIFDQSGLIDYVTSAKGLALKDIDEMLGKREREREKKEGRKEGSKEGMEEGMEEGRKEKSERDEMIKRVREKN